MPDAYVEGLDLVPNVDKGHLDILVHGNEAAKGLTVRRQVLLFRHFILCLWSNSLLVTPMRLHTKKE